MERNELLLELYRAGIFDPSNREAALGVLAGMDFDGIEPVRAVLKQDSCGEAATP